MLPARRDIGGGQWCAVVKLDSVAYLEGVGLAAVGRLRHRGAQIADKIGRRGRVFRVHPDQHAVERSDRMEGRESTFAMRVKARRGIRRDHVSEIPAAFAGFLFVRRRCQCRRPESEYAQTRCQP